jgi:hypothetical protein
MSELPRDILQCIGNTSLLALRNIVPKNDPRILLKLENESSTGSRGPDAIQARNKPPDSAPPARFREGLQTVPIRKNLSLEEFEQSRWVVRDDSINVHSN